MIYKLKVKSINLKKNLPIHSKKKKEGKQSKEGKEGKEEKKG